MMQAVRSPSCHYFPVRFAPPCENIVLRTMKFQEIETSRAFAILAIGRSPRGERG